MFELKNYQRNALDILAGYLLKAREANSETAYNQALREQNIDIIPPYRTNDLGDIPYVCLRLPTGGGKTVLASYAIRDVALNYLFKVNPLVLWLVPTTKIAEQTLSCLQHPGHPYRQAIDEYFGGKVSVFDIADVVNIRPQDFDQKAVIVVGTLATLRITDTTGRRIYDHNENYQPHFERLSKNIDGLDKIGEGKDKGKPKYSFANLCYLLKPLVIMDEAHNARTPLSFETLKRLNPSCIIELTATPDTSVKSGSNILYSVSALALKNEDMIKLPIMLTEHQMWELAVANTVLKRAELAELAKNETEYIRPIALYQAESKDKEVTVEVLKKHLMEKEDIPESKIAIYTGSIKELDGIDLFNNQCDIEHIITVEALKEGWDCSFAYVFCSVANIKSSRDVEQLLGRVLRMPYAKKRTNPDLNCAYANVSSQSFAKAAEDLVDALVNKMGFEKLEANAFVQPGKTKGQISTDQTEIFDQEHPAVMEVSEIDESKLSDETKKELEIKKDGGKTSITTKSDITDDTIEELLRSVPQEEVNKIQKTIATQRLGKAKRVETSEKRDKSMLIPRLIRNVQGEIDFLDSDSLLEAGEWDILSFKAELPDFRIVESGNTFEISISDNSKVTLREDSSENYFDYAIDLPDYKDSDLVYWLDRETRQQDIHQTTNMNFNRQIINYLMQMKGYKLVQLFKAKYQLRTAIINLINAYRKEAMKTGFQKLLFDNQDNIEVSFEYSLEFKPGDMNYFPNRFYSGNRKFNKHYYENVGDMNTEEVDCALAIDRMKEVKYWVRNIERQPNTSFWFQTSTDKFYPDFVAELTDGRILVIEYKGAMIASTLDTQEKTDIGKLWEKKSCGKGVFIMCTKEMVDKLDMLIKA